MKYVFPFFLAFILWSCDAKKPASPQKSQEKACQQVQANTTIELGVKGMVCQMGCGGSIRKALKETCAVARVEVNYIDSIEEQTILVHYDRKQIAPSQMLSLLSTINDQQFTARIKGTPTNLK